MPIFNNARDYIRFTQTLSYYMHADIKQKFSIASTFDILEIQHNDKAVDIIAYCFMPNHFHLLLKQKVDEGISQFMRDIGISYTRYFNTKLDRVGPLFQGQFKAVRIETLEQLLHVSRYIHLNPTVGFIVEKLEDYPWSSLHEYVGPKHGVCTTDDILSNFHDKQDYKRFILDQEGYAKQIAVSKHLLLDFEE